MELECYDSSDINHEKKSFKIIIELDILTYE